MLPDLRKVWSDSEGRRYWAILCPRCKGHGRYAGRSCTHDNCAGTGYLLKWEGEKGGPNIKEEMI
jgi:DnaJ-class molecular chaperone